MREKILVPDVGEAEDIEVVELLVSKGDVIDVDASLVVLESDKASMEIPSPFAGTVVAITVSEGDKVEEGSMLVEVETGGGEAPAANKAPAASKKPAASKAPAADDKEPAADDDKAPAASKKPAADDKEPAADKAPAANKKPATAEKPQEEPPQQESPPDESEPPPPAIETGAASPLTPPDANGETPVHAGPAVRKQAREYGVPLSEVLGSGQKGRILKEDIQAYVKARLGGGVAASGPGIPPVPEVDFAKFGEIEHVPLSRIRKASARNLSRSWLNVPHVTQFDEADITDLEAFRREQNDLLQSEGVKLTPLAFLIKAAVTALQKYPRFNASIASDLEHLIHKKHYHIGIAVETDEGLVVPVLKDADRKGVVALAQGSAELAAQARARKLPMDAMQGATFTISSLGGIGGTAFTPIVNAPEVAILGVSRARVAPVWNGADFEPRTMLPLSLSYDHRAIDGAEAARFTDYLAKVLGDLRRIIL